MKRLVAFVREATYDIRWALAVIRWMWRNRHDRPCRQKYRRMDVEIRRAMRA